ncbi:Nrap protein [Schizopora paradoxa]|uniref:U3 small nucleolar RNA-associated protein 22 n=1 Tax=Schizopora paradoxa TaxID=27342 RepID=A0A0H2RUC5_9AGAM|nr:Nrap protein [Schizopora paradoxa]
MEWEGFAGDEASTSKVDAKVDEDSTKARGSNRPPTRDELREIKNASELFSSNTFKLQIDALLANIRPKASRLPPLETFLLALHSQIMNLPSMSPMHPLQASRDLLRKGIAVPFPTPLPTEETNWKVAFEKPNDITIVGSWATKTGVRSKLGSSWTVDIAVEMPDNIFQEKDYLDGRFFHKRAFYLANLAAGLTSKKDLNVEFEYDSVAMDTRLTTLVIRKRKDGSKYDFSKLDARIRLIPTLGPSHPISINHLSPTNCNLRIKPQNQSDESKSTPIYNNILLSCTTPRARLLQTYSLMQQVPALQDALALLRTWANQRGFCDGSETASSVFGLVGRGYFWTALFAMLVLGQESSQVNGKKSGAHGRTVGKGLSSYQLFRAALDFLARHDFSTPVITKGGNRFPFEQYLNYRGAIFIDSSSINVLEGVPMSTLDTLRMDAQISLDLLNNTSKANDPFAEVFLKEQNQSARFDVIVRVNLQTAKLRNPSLLEALDFGSLSYQVIYTLCDLLRRALTDRATAIAVLTPSSTNRPCNQGNASASLSYVDIGLLLNPNTAFRLVDHGPPAAETDSQETLAFRELWGDKAELRRFKDGRIEESVVWEVKTTDDRTKIPSMIIEHIVQRHLGLKGDQHVTCYQTDYDALLRLPEQFTKLSRGGRGQPGFRGAQSAFDDLHRALKGMDEELPLSLLSVSPVCGELRYTSTFAPFPVPGDMFSSLPTPMRYVPVMDLVLQFERSGRWPDDLAAIQKTKLAFFETIGTALMTKLPGLRAFVVTSEDETLPATSDQARLELLTADGWAFSVRIWHDREATLLQRILEKKPPYLQKIINTPDATTLERKQATEALQRYTRRFIHAPRHHKAVAALCHRFTAYAGTVRLTKRWLASHWLLQAHIGDEAIELICANVFLSRAKSTFAKDEDEVPIGVPSSKEAGFIRVVSFLKEWTWEDGIFVPLYDEGEQSEEERQAAQIKAGSGAIGVWTISTSFDTEGKMWTCDGPDILVARRIKQLANAAWACLPALEKDQVHPKSLFLHPTEDYDILIHLDPSAVRRYHQNVNFDLATITQPRKFMNLPNKGGSDEDDGAVRVGFDPVALFVSDLRRVYSGTLQFFCDCFGGLIIGAVWDPSIAASSRPFRVMAMYSSTPHVEVRGSLPEKAKSRDLVVLNKPAILAEINRLGEGLVKSIEIQRKEDRSG